MQNNQERSNERNKGGREEEDEDNISIYNINSIFKSAFLGYKEASFLGYKEAYQAVQPHHRNKANKNLSSNWI